MKRPRIKFITSIAVVFVLTFLLVMFFGGMYGYVAIGSENDGTKDRVQDFSQILANIADNETKVEEQRRYFNDLDMQIATFMLKDLIVDGNYTGSRLFSDGMVIRYDGKSIDFPEHQEGKVPHITPEFIDSGKEMTDEIILNGKQTEVVVKSGKIDEEWYYIDWLAADDQKVLNNSGVDINSIMNSIEETNDCFLLIIDNNHNVRYDSFPEDPTSADDGFELSEEYFKKNRFHFIDGEAYALDYLRIPETGWEVYTLINTASTVNEGSDWGNLFIAVAVLFTVTMIVWNYAVQRLVQKHVLSKEQETKYNPAQVRMVNIVSAAVTFILVFVISLLFYGALTLRKDISRGKNMMYNLKTGLLEDEFRESFTSIYTQDWYVYYADKIAELSGEYDNHPSHDKLAKLNELMEVTQYFILYDDKGNEIVASNDFIDFSLGTDTKDPTTDFRRILKGIDHVVHQPAHDDFTGLDSQLIAVRMKMKNDRPYGVLVMSLYPYVLETNAFDSVSKRIESMASGEDIIIGFDNEYSDVTFCSNDDYKLLDASAFGIDLNKRLDDQMNVYNIEGDKYYGQSFVDADLEDTFYYLVKDTFSFRQGLKISALLSLCFLAVYCAGIFTITRGYTQQFFEDNFLVGDPPISSQTIKVMLADGRVKKTTDISKRFSLVPRFWNNMLPEQKAEFVFNLLLFGYLISRILIDRNNLSGSDYLFDYVMQGNWTRGFNLLALFAVVILLIICLIGLIIVRNIVTVLCLVLDTKGETILRLAFNLFQYVVLIAFLYYAFGFLGFNTAGILASVGFVTLAISIGSRDLVADIVAGLVIVLEGEYQIGDMIEIGGYRGQVQEIGVRSTKILGRGNNVKIVGNRDVKNVINLTRNNSWIPIEIKVSSDQSLPEIEKILEEELPKIAKTNPKILGGPYYYGVLGFDKGSVRLSIITECHEEDYNNVERYLYKALYELLKEKRVMIG